MMGRLLLGTFLVMGCGLGEGGPLRVGVLSASLQDDGFGADLAALHWAVENVNAVGGVAGGRAIELVPMDWQADYDDYESFLADPSRAAKRMLDDEDIVATVGPLASTAVMAVGKAFRKRKKTMITTAGSGAVMRAFGGKGYLWRARESDIAQIELMVLTARRRGAQRVALLAPFGSYGETFFDWFGFFAAELGMEVTGVQRIDMETMDPGPEIDTLLGGQPDALLLVPTTDAVFAQMADHLYFEVSDPPMVLFSDGAFWPDMLSFAEEIWPYDSRWESEGHARKVLEGLQGLVPVPQPDSGFAVAFTDRFGYAAGSDFDASLYDGLLMLAYGLQQSEGAGGAALSSAMKRVADGRGYPTGWDRVGIAQTLDALDAGRNPDVVGATGSLTFDSTLYTELADSTFALWQIEEGRYGVREYLATGKGQTRSTSGQSVFQSFASAAAQQRVESGVDPLNLGEREELWAVIAAVSSGWENYRHQADALAQYQMLKARGIADDRIIMIGADDLADHPDNALPGVVRNAPGGENLYKDAVYDYTLEAFQPTDLINILKGEATDRTPVVLQSGANDNVYVYIVGHGGNLGVVFDAQTPAQATLGVAGSAALAPGLLQNAVDTMFATDRYRRLLLVIEACHGGVMGAQLDTPGALAITAANPFENSKGHGYDAELDQWVADQFSRRFYEVVTAGDSLTVGDLYSDVYLGVAGSHVSIYNSLAFGDVWTIEADEFLWR